MKILHVTPYIHSSYGGPSVAVRSMAEAMVLKGAEVHVAVTNAAGQHHLLLSDCTIRNEEGVYFHYFRRRFPLGWFRAPSLAVWLNQQAINFDLLHLHVPFTWTFRYAALTALAIRRPYVVTPHGVLDPWSLRQKAWKKRPYLRLLERKTLRGAAALHVTAQNEASSVENLQLGPKIHCLPLSVPFPSEQLFRPQIDGVLRILCIARLHQVKALPVLFKALAHIRKQGKAVVLDLAGDGDSDYVAILRREVYSLGLQENVVWHGQVDEAKKRELYAKATCFALLSHHENFGLAAAEAMGSGLPVVVSDQVGLAPDVVKFHAGIVVPVGDDAAAAQALLKFMDHSTRVNAGDRARQLVQQCYGSKAFADGLEEMYRDAMFK